MVYLRSLFWKTVSLTIGNNFRVKGLEPRFECAAQLSQSTSCYGAGKAADEQRLFQLEQSRKPEHEHGKTHDLLTSTMCER